MPYNMWHKAAEEDYKQYAVSILNKHEYKGSFTMAKAKKAVKMEIKSDGKLVAEAHVPSELLAPLTTTEKVLAREEAKIKESKLDLKRRIEKLEAQVESLQIENTNLFEKSYGYQIKVKRNLEVVSTLQDLINEKLYSLVSDHELLDLDEG